MLSKEEIASLLVAGVVGLACGEAGETLYQGDLDNKPVLSNVTYAYNGTREQ